MANQKCIATVYWRSPQHGGYAETPKKMLSIDASITEGTKYIAFNNDFGTERYVFNSERDALAFKQKVEEAYRRKPQYYVIDDNANPVVEDGEPLVAWEPEITLTRKVA